VQYKDFTYIVAHTLKTPILRNILIGCLAISVLFPTYSTFFMLPLFSEELVADTEDNANRTATYLLSSLSLKPDNFTKASFSPHVVRGIEQAVKDLQLEKIKAFSKSGEIIYSTDVKDIGLINRKPYFHEIVAKGRKYTITVRKNGETAENRIVDRDVAEIYIPIMHDNVFSGAFEIYYDITDRKQKLDDLLSRYSAVLYAMSIILFLSISGLLLQVSNSMIRRRKAEKELQAAHDGLQDLVSEQVNEIMVTQTTSVEALAVLAEYYDHDTGAHLVRLQKYVVLLASWLQNNSPYSMYITRKPDYIGDIKLASLLHDIGKIAIPRALLNKPGKLTKEEFEIVKKHTVIAGEVLNKANASFIVSFGKDSYLALARDIALYHHEQWNGGGYPHGLKGETIPLSARIVALADVYDALRSVRPYKKAFTHMYAVDIITKDEKEHFDPYVLEAFRAQADKFCEISSHSRHNLTG
jgi:HD-GYP domain-containing protein (c-di-GMP phosphodiesterase class II)